MLFKEFAQQLCERTSLATTVEGEESDRELQIATVLLLMLLGEVDDEFHPDELTALVQGIGNAFVIDDWEVGALMELAEIVLKQEGCLAEGIDLISESFDAKQKEEILTIVWKVILADGVAEKMEAEYAALVREKLGLSLDVAIRARQRAEHC